MLWQDPTLQEKLAIDSDQAKVKAQEFWSQAGVETHGLKSNVLMGSAKLADGYLGKEHLHDQYDVKATQGAPIVYWTVSFYEEAGNNSYTTHINPDTGQIVSWQRNDLVASSNADTVASAELARQALQKQGVQAEASEVELLHIDNPTASNAKPKPDNPSHLLAYDYRYKVPAAKWQVGEMTLEYQVHVVGNAVTGFFYTFHTPEEFQTWHARQEKMGTLLTGLSLLFSFVLFVLAFVYLFLVKQKKPWWSALGLSVLATVLFALANLNELPSIQQQYVNTGSGVLERTIGSAIVVAGVIILAVLAGGATYVLTLTGGALVKEVRPQLWTPRRDPNWSGNVRLAMWRGYALAFVWLALQNVFYLIWEKVFGVWVENDFSMSPSNMWVPLLFPLMAWLAGIQEEVTYRLFGVTFFKKYWKSSLVACLLPAMVWALGHSLYPVYPMYTRVIELTIFGVLIGYCYLWWGLETVIFAHVVFDTVQMVIPFLFGGEGIEIGAGVVYLLVPIAVGYGLHWFRGRQEKGREPLAPL